MEQLGKFRITGQVPRAWRQYCLPVFDWSLARTVAKSIELFVPLRPLQPHRGEHAGCRGVFVLFRARAYRPLAMTGRAAGQLGRCPNVVRLSQLSTQLRPDCPGLSNPY